MQNTYSSQFEKWRIYMRQKQVEKWQQREKWEYYLADILNSLSVLIECVPNFRSGWRPRPRTRDEALIDFSVNENKKERDTLWASTQKAFWSAIRHVVKGKGKSNGRN